MIGIEIAGFLGGIAVGRSALRFGLPIDGVLTLYFASLAVAPHATSGGTP
jgi:hypothetical protein